MSELLLDRAGRRRSPATWPGFRAGRAPCNKGLRHSAVTDEGTEPRLVPIVSVLAMLLRRVSTGLALETIDKRLIRPDVGGATPYRVRSEQR
jgi:hypothetical protein